MIPYYMPSRYRKATSEDEDEKMSSPPPRDAKAAQKVTYNIATKTSLAGHTEDELLAELAKRKIVLDDSASSVGGASSASSEGSTRRRRRRNRNKQVQKTTAPATTTTAPRGTLPPPKVIPRLADSKPARLQIGLNLDAELELKARLQGDICLTLLVQRKHRPRESTELKPNWRGVVDVEEMFHMHVGTLDFRKRWLDHDVSPSLTAAAMFSIAMGGFVAGFAASRWLDTWVLGIPPLF
ncbi:hypothetical protein CMUS01_02005 [Colletotrichum musicola]|uniref:Uncharacterized protein n=1 Tax=Colletotrichum musicola TaxID=2175873 RepID=A0A8H6NW35_9PEZI|nr:hypothetical protein CMUS01_02005 [Colletotrichum musicola]